MVNIPLLLNKLRGYQQNFPIQKNYQKLVIVVFFILIFHVTFIRDNTPIKDEEWPATHPVVRLFTLFADARPQTPPLNEYIGNEKVKQKFATDNDFFFTKEYLSNLLNVDERDVTELKSKHEYFLKKVKELPFKTFATPEKHLQGDGIVIVGGGKFSWLALLNIHQLRATGCQLPVEVYLPTYNDYEAQFCETILPSINARCVIGAKEYPSFKFHDQLKFKGFQLKIMALFASYFERVLLLDADNVVTIDPTKLFSWQTFKDTGLVVWPDSWTRTTQPRFYDIAGIKVGDRPTHGKTKDNTNPDEWDFHDFEGTLPNPTCESGMLLLDKKQTVDAMLLAFYYNIHGPDYYYPLLTQGGAGEGDKDTFIAAAYAVKQPIYMVQQSMSFLGYHDDSGYHSKALGQWDPLTPRETNKDAEGECMFMHLSYPKLFPDQLRGEITRETTDGSHRKMYVSGEANKHYGFDLRMWELMTQLICDGFEPNTNPDPASVLIPQRQRLDGLKLDFIKSVDGESFCKPLHIPHLRFLRESRD
ncbi:unnamed protein product [Ambrosiozyma monospora]|uniref:Unnamed protein product n=1 Tax=Ambrosiozyma monospora TaxID=43982 RepID=A0ACB5SYL3_AMBMO|nr:unnamed protein product [Ambrosiozyma monospora]